MIFVVLLVIRKGIGFVTAKIKKKISFFSGDRLHLRNKNEKLSFCIAFSLHYLCIR